MRDNDGVEFERIRFWYDDTSDTLFARIADIISTLHGIHPWYFNPRHNDNAATMPSSATNEV